MERVENPTLIVKYNEALLKKAEDSSLSIKDAIELVTIKDFIDSALPYVPNLDQYLLETAISILTANDDTIVWFIKVKNEEEYFSFVNQAGGCDVGDGITVVVMIGNQVYIPKVVDEDYLYAKDWLNGLTNRIRNRKLIPHEVEITDIEGNKRNVTEFSIRDLSEETLESFKDEALYDTILRMEQSDMVRFYKPAVTIIHF